MSDFKFEVIRDFGVITERGEWATRLRLISFNGKPAKYDIRPWNINSGKMGKGITLQKEELEQLRNLLNEMSFLDEDNNF